MKQYKIIAEHTEGSIIFRESMDDALATKCYGKVEQVDLMEMNFKSSLKFKDGINKEVYHTRMHRLAELLLQAHPEQDKVVFEPKGIWMFKGSCPSKVTHCGNTKEVLAYIDGYWDTITLQQIIKHNQRG